MARFSHTNNSLHLNVYIDQGGQNIPSNQSTVNWRVTVSRTGAYYTFNQTGDSSLVVTIDGAQVHSSNPRWATSGAEVQLASGSYTVGHHADGTKSVAISANFNPNNGIHGRIITSGNLGLTTIPRASSVSVSAGVIGGAVTINISRQSSNFKHTVRYQWGSRQGTIASNVDTSTTWTIPLDFANEIPNATSGTGTIFVDTYSGNTKTGTQSTTLTASVPASMKPTFTGVTLTDHNTAAQSLIAGNTFIQVISNIKVAFNGGTGSYGSTITGYKAEIVGKNQTTNVNGGTLGIMNYNGTITVRASVFDSRGRWSDTKDVSVTVLEYFAPVLKLDVTRTGATSSVLTVTRNAKVAPLTVGGAQKNTMSLSFKVARLGTSNYTADSGNASGNWISLASLTNSQANLSGTYVANQSWVVVGTLEDRFTRTEFAVNVATESVVLSYDRSGVGVNKIRERGALDVKGDIYVNDKPIQQHQLTNTEGNTIYAYNTDVNTHVNNGIRWINPNCANSPFPSNYGWIETCRATTDIFQIAKSWYGGWKVYRRHATSYRASDGSANWNEWVEITPQTNHTNLINTGWQSAGYPGTYYKRVGDILAIKYDFVGNGSTINIGSIPSSVWVAPQSYMLLIAKWSTDGAANSHVQINHGTGALNVLSTGNGTEYRGQLTIMI
ncbi:DUF859 family phage minor structural protein [Streptococcus suis]|uniref:Phage structural protein n=1 Tax=Streptococcus suis TaxID=1307 RepID=A0A116MYN3_STRSU|nr:DUF859 family phage minor structural protein [Streptococcus suis]NQG44780.1 hypothetical protein [Streptococcus suis]CYV72634.1 phage structural protein [Streptococcus suis]